MILTNILIAYSNLFQADVLVNSLGQQDSSLDQCGIISKAFHAAVGKKLQDEFEKTGGLKAGDVSCSTICSNLSCKMLIHLGLDKWNGTQTKQVESLVIRDTPLLGAV